MKTEVELIPILKYPIESNSFPCSKAVAPQHFSKKHFYHIEP